MHDQAANMIAVARLLTNQGDGNWVSLGCMAHSLQTSLRRAFEESGQVQKVLAEGRRLVSHFHQSPIATQHLLNKQVKDITGHLRKSDPNGDKYI